MRSSFFWLQVHAYGKGRRTAIAARVVEGTLSLGVFTSADRTRSVLRLNELFFGLCDERSIDIFIEAGAKEATASRRAVGLGCRAVAFEANPYTYRRFAASLAGTTVDYRHQALSNRPGSATFMVRLDENRQPIADGQGSLLVRPDHDPGYEKVTVDATTLDHHVRLLAMPDARIAMWVDVEGALAEVFGGGHAVLKRTDVLIVEVESVRRWDKQQWLVADVIDAMEASGLVPVARDVQSRHQHNIVFVRDALLDTGAVSAMLAEFRRIATDPSSG